MVDRYTDVDETTTTADVASAVPLGLVLRMRKARKRKKCKKVYDENAGFRSAIKMFGMTSSGLSRSDLFVKKQTPGRRMFQQFRLVPVEFLSRFGKNRRKVNKRKDRKSALVGLTSLR